MSLQSRLDIICDEAEGDSGSNIDDGRESSNEISTEKPVAQLVLQLLRSVTCNIDLFETVDILQHCLTKQLYQKYIYSCCSATGWCLFNLYHQLL